MKLVYILCHSVTKYTLPESVRLAVLTRYDDRILKNVALILEQNHLYLMQEHI